MASAPQRRPIDHSPVQRIGKILLQGAIVAIIVLTLLELIAGRAIYRQEAGGIDQFRLCTYQVTLSITSDDWPLGSGFGTFSNILPSYRDPECSGILGTWEMAHNFFLEGVASLGLVFCTVTVVAYLTLIWTFVNGMKRSPKSRKAAALGLSALVLLTLHSMVDFSLQIPGVANFAAAFLGICVVASISSRSNFDERTPTEPAQRARYRHKSRHPHPEIESKPANAD